MGQWRKPVCPGLLPILSDSLSSWKKVPQLPQDNERDVDRMASPTNISPSPENLLLVHLVQTPRGACSCEPTSSCYIKVQILEERVWPWSPSLSLKPHVSCRYACQVPEGETDVSILLLIVFLLWCGGIRKGPLLAKVSCLALWFSQPALALAWGGAKVCYPA